MLDYKFRYVGYRFCISRTKLYSIHCLEGLAAENGLRVTADCICPEQNITYECTAVGGSHTVWSGSVIPNNCTVALPHTQFFNRPVPCMGGVVGRGIEISGNCYTSQLTVPVTPNLDGRNVSCSVDNVMDVPIIDTLIINITRGKLNFHAFLSLIKVMPPKILIYRTFPTTK